jgi:hypothetical protein
LEENCCKKSHIAKTSLGNSFGSQSDENTIACHLLFQKSSVSLSRKKRKKVSLFHGSFTKEFKNTFQISTPGMEIRGELLQ